MEGGQQVSYRGLLLHPLHQAHERAVEILDCGLREALDTRASWPLADTASKRCNSSLSSGSASRWENPEAP